jgi:hypothetical protein
MLKLNACPPPLPHAVTEGLKTGTPDAIVTAFGGMVYTGDK